MKEQLAVGPVARDFMEKHAAIWKGQKDCVLVVVVYLDSCLRFTQSFEKGPAQLGSTFAEGVYTAIL